VPDPDRYVHALIDKVRYSVEQQEADLDGRIGFEESIDDRPYVQATE
jgi:hypothetical protein